MESLGVLWGTPGQSRGIQGHSGILLVTLWALRVAIRPLRVTQGHFGVTQGLHLGFLGAIMKVLRVTLGTLMVTLGALRVTLGSLMRQWEAQIFKMYISVKNHIKKFSQWLNNCEKLNKEI